MYSLTINNTVSSRSATSELFGIIPIMSFSLISIVSVVILLSAIWQYIIYPVFFSPLSKIPKAHPTSSFSSLWILWKRHQAQENTVIHAAHKRHGGIVRLGPNEISVTCVDEGIRTVYSGGFEKWKWYENQFCNYGYACAFILQSVYYSLPFLPEHVFDL